MTLLKQMLVRLAFIGLATGIATSASAASTDGWPASAIRLVVPFAPGGGVDICARIIAQKLGPALGASIIVENRSGGGGIVGTTIAAHAKPDGNTLLLSSVGPIAVNPHLYSNLSYKPQADFEPISLVGNALNVLVVNPSLPVHSVKELIAYGKAHPGKLSFGSSGFGQTDMLSGELFKSMAGIQMTHVPYSGGTPAMLDLMSGQIQLIFATVSTAVGPLKGNKIRPISMTGTKRFSLMPNIPTVNDTLPGFVVNNWYGLEAPAGTPRPIIDRLNAEIVKIFAMPDVQSILLAQGIEATTDSPDEFKAYIQAEDTKWAKVIHDAGIQAR